MKRVNRIWEHPLYREAYVRIQELEQDREFCGHSAEHFLAVARLMRIYDLQEDTGLSKESIYAAALLHDIGRHLQYLEGTPHQEASAALAAEILPGLRLSRTRDERDPGGHPGPPLSGDPAGKKPPWVSVPGGQGFQELPGLSGGAGLRLAKRKKESGDHRLDGRTGSMRIGTQEFDTKNQTYVMGILNVTPDSFSDGGRYNQLDAALFHAEAMLQE